MVNLDKYRNDGWGLSKKEFELLYEQLKQFNKDQEYNVVEFGSGRSTEFLIDVMDDLGLNIKIDSFDDSTEYSFKGQHPNLNLNIVSLVECDDDSFNEMFEKKSFDPTKVNPKFSPVHTRQKNTFYKIVPKLVPKLIDLLIVDGPHGNGRSLAYLHCKDKFKDGSLVLIDDASHYPFYEHLQKVIDSEIIYEQHIREDKWNKGGDFVLCKIKK